MDMLQSNRTFLAVAEQGSFTAAADQIGLSNRLTSKYVAELEARLGVRLLQRTTRTVGLTPAGEDLLARAPALLDDLDDLLAQVSDSSRGFSGVIRISAPVTFGEIYVTGMIARFTAAHPDLNIDLRLSDSFVDLAAEGIDLAFRIGESDVQSLKSRKLGALRSVLVASPDYLRSHGTPQSPADLARHICIVDRNRRNPRRWVLDSDADDGTVHVQGRFLVNSARAAVDLAANSCGIAFVPRFSLGSSLTDGTLVPLLPESAPAQIPIAAAYLEGRKLPRKVRALIDFAAQDIRQAGIL